MEFGIGKEMRFDIELEEMEFEFNKLNVCESASINYAKTSKFEEV
jgi:hypothetical protein